MATSYFIRLRGNVQGPFDVERLRQLARRGQFTRLHEVSADGQEWRPAGEFSELFPSSVGIAAALSAPPSATPYGDSSPAGVAAVGLPPGIPAEAWYYELAGQPQGPVDLATLQRLLGQGQLTLRARVWKAGMADWMPAGNIPQLAAAAAERLPAYARRAEPSPAESRSPVGYASEEVAPEIVEALEDSRKWVLLLAVAGLLITVTWLLTFVGELVLAVLVRSFTMAVLSIVPLATAVVLGVGPWLLWRYAHGIHAVGYTRQTRALYHSVKVLKGYWIYTSVLCTVVVIGQILGTAIVLAMMSDTIGALLSSLAGRLT